MFLPALCLSSISITYASVLGYVACRLSKYAKSARPAKWYIPTPADGPAGLVREVGTQVARTIPVPTRSDGLLSVLVARLAGGSRTFLKYM
jgi:hypothetical protein